jgi:hypothetical protein
MFPCITIYFFVDNRKTVNEFAGNDRVIFVPENFTLSVFGETLVGFSNVFSSNPLADVNTMALPLPESDAVPFRSI